MASAWWWSRPKGPRFRTYGAERGYIGKSAESEACEAEGPFAEWEGKSSSVKIDEQCSNCGVRVGYPIGRFCWDCEQHDRVVHPRRGAQLYPEYFKLFTCAKCERAFVGFTQLSPCEGCPYSDCFHEASPALRRVFARRTCSVEQVSCSMKDLFCPFEE